MNVSRFLNQTPLWSARQGLDRYGEPSYADPLPIAARIEGGYERVSTETGEEVTATARAFTTSLVSTGDRLEVRADHDPRSHVNFEPPHKGQTLEVVTHENKLGVNGDFSHRELRLR